MFYTIPTSRVVFTGKTNLDLFSLRRKNRFGLVQSWEMGDRNYEIRCLFVAVGLYALYIVLPHLNNMS